MAYNAAKPADDEFIADAPAAIRENQRALRDDRIVDAGTLQGLSPGHASGEIPVADGTVCAGLNADKVDGKDAGDFADVGHGHSNATTGSPGFMSNTDKSKLDGVAVGAEVNQNAFASVKIGGVTISADSKTDLLEFLAGSNITLTPDATNDKITIAVSGTVPLAADADTLDGQHATAFAPSGYGIGETATAKITDLDTGKTGGLFYWTTGATGAPTTAGALLVMSRLLGYVSQVAVSYSGGEMFTRYFNGTSWSAWVEIWDAAHDGSGSGLDADLLDGQHLSYITGLIDAKQATSAKGAANGYAGLDASADVPEANLPDTLANAKTFNGKVTMGDEVVFDALVNVTGTTVTWGYGNKQQKSLTGNVALAFGVPGGPTGLQLELVQGATAYTVTWPSSVHWVGGDAPDLSTANKRYVCSFFWDGTYYIGSCGGGA